MFALQERISRGIHLAMIRKEVFELISNDIRTNIWKIK
jgi:hypothetical protein